MKLNPDNIPQHIAIIMDGNGRWAKERRLPRSQGHYQGVRRVEEIIDTAKELGVKALTLYTFSTENWSRPKNEVSVLMKMISFILTQKTQKLVDLNIRFQLIGKREGVPQDLLNIINQVVDKTANNDGMVLNMAFNYGSRLEMLDAIKMLAQRVQQGEIAVDEINEEVFSDALYTSGLPDPDLLIRTSGEKRISNFLLWQLSYAEFYFTDKFWPDFDSEEFKKAIFDFQNRERRFGAVSNNS